MAIVGGQEVTVEVDLLAAEYAGTAKGRWTQLTLANTSLSLQALP
jgi:hypothetical protein